MAKKAHLSALLQLLIIAGIAGLVTVGAVAWNYNWMNLRFKVENAANGGMELSPTDTCPKTSADMGSPCCKVLEGGELQPAVAAVYVRAPCKCPSDTHYLTDAPEGNGIIICECNDCPGE